MPLNQRVELPKEAAKPATASIVANAEAPLANIDTSVKTAENLDMGNQHVPRRIEEYGMRPKYLRYNVWDPEGILPITTADWTETALPLPRPPLCEIENVVVQETINKHPNLFKIVSPV